MEIIEYNELLKYNFPVNELFEFCVVKNSEKFYFKFKYTSKSNKLLVLSNGAVKKKKKKPPVYMRSNWANDFDSNCLFIDDKTIHDVSINIGWGFGRKNRFYLDDYHKIVLQLCRKFNFENDHVFYFGSSAGGFMSTILATLHQGSTAIVNNPQMFVFNYDERAVNSLYSKLVPELTKEEIEKKYIRRLSTVAMMRVKKNVPRLFYIQNRASEEDMIKHVNVFNKRMKLYNMDSDKIQYLLYYDEEMGHSPLDKTETVNIVNRILNNEFTF